MSPIQKALRVADAKNRSLRVLLNGALYTVGLAVVMVLLPVFTSAGGWADLDWSRIGWSVFQAAVMAGIAYLMRTVLDPSKVPTPLPPGDPGQPDAPPAPNEGGAVNWILVCAICLILLVLFAIFGVPHFR